jgi:RNA-directed DNA polymerase
MQVLQRRWDWMFSEHRYGFRPGRSAPQAVEAAPQYIAEGYRWWGDLDLEKFCDRVSHDKLRAKRAQWVSDQRLLKLMRAFLKAGVMENGLRAPSAGRRASDGEPHALPHPEAQAQGERAEECGSTTLGAEVSWF